MTQLDAMLKASVDEAQKMPAIPPVPMAIVVLVTQVSVTEASVNIQWPPQMPIEHVANALAAATRTVKQQDAARRGGIVLPS